VTKLDKPAPNIQARQEHTSVDRQLRVGKRHGSVLQLCVLEDLLRERLGIAVLG
jgi:hypothetical protein